MKILQYILFVCIGAMLFGLMARVKVLEEKGGKVVKEKWMYAMVCKNMPPMGQDNWPEWLLENGECKTGVKAPYKPISQATLAHIRRNQIDIKALLDDVEKKLEQEALWLN